jgi:hypothetical protein
MAFPEKNRKPSFSGLSVFVLFKIFLLEAAPQVSLKVHEHSAFGMDRLSGQQRIFEFWQL